LRSLFGIFSGIPVIALLGAFNLSRNFIGKVYFFFFDALAHFEANELNYARIGILK